MAARPASPRSRVDAFLAAAIEIHTSWIRRFDRRYPRFPRPPAAVEAARRRIALRLQVLQRVRAEAPPPGVLGARLRSWLTAPEAAGLDPADGLFARALLEAWERGEAPSEAALVAGAALVDPAPGREQRRR